MPPNCSLGGSAVQEGRDVGAKCREHRGRFTPGGREPAGCVRVGDDLYVRSAHGPDNGWFRRAKASGRGRIQAGGVERDVTFEPADGAPQDAIDAAYHAKYDQYGPAIVGPVVGPQAHPVTLRVVPAGA